MKLTISEPPSIPTWRTYFGSRQNCAVSLNQNSHDNIPSAPTDDIMNRNNKPDASIGTLAFRYTHTAGGCGGSRERLIEPYCLATKKGVRRKRARARVGKPSGSCVWVNQERLLSRQVDGAFRYGGSNCLKGKLLHFSGAASFLGERERMKVSSG